MALNTQSREFQKQSMPETAMVATTSKRPVLRAVHSLDFDEAQLLAETEELLGNLDPIAFLDVVHTTKQTEVNIAPHCSSASTSSESALDSSSDDPSDSQSPIKLEPTGKSNRKCGSKPMRNPSRERMQNELRHLRKQVVALETELQNTHERNGTSHQSNVMTMPRMWERVAKRELVSCDRAVKDNKRLKSMLKLQKELVVDLEESLYNWQHAITLPSTLTLGHSVPSKTVRLESGDDLLFEMLVSELDAAYLGIDSAFQEAGIKKHGFEAITRSTPKTHVSSDGSLRSYFELVEVDVTPFDFELTSRVAIICGEQQSQSPDCVVYSRDWGFEHAVITEKHRVKRVLNGVEIYFHMLLALKVHEFKDRVVTVWRSMFKSEGRHHFPDAYVKETGWMTSSRLVHSASDIMSTGEGSLYRMCVHLEPKSFASPAAVLQAQDDVMTTLVVSSYHDDMQELDDMMEKMLIQESSKSTL